MEFLRLLCLVYCAPRLNFSPLFSGSAQERERTAAEAEAARTAAAQRANADSQGREKEAARLEELKREAEVLALSVRTDFMVGAHRPSFTSNTRSPFFAVSFGVFVMQTERKRLESERADAEAKAADEVCSPFASSAAAVLRMSAHFCSSAA